MTSNDTEQGNIKYQVCNNCLNYAGRETKGEYLSFFQSILCAHAHAHTHMESYEYFFSDIFYSVFVISIS